MLAVTLSFNNNHTHKPKSNSSDGEILTKDFLFCSQLELTIPSHDAADCCGALCSLVAQARREQGGSAGRPIVHSARRWFGLARALLRVLQPPSSCCCCHPFCVHRSPATHPRPPGCQSSSYVSTGEAVTQTKHDLIFQRMNST